MYRSAKSKDDAKLSAIRQELEADFASKSTADISTVIEAHKQELNEFAKVAEQLSVFFLKYVYHNVLITAQ